MTNEQSASHADTQKKDFIIVSVESRKGGVGKTTAALNLARLFKDSGYSVLFLDVDITGTNAADGLDSPFWKDITAAVTFNGGKANLLKIFQSKFMTGDGIPPFSTNDGKEELRINLERINVFGSQIYDFDKSKEESSGKAGKHTKIVCKPSILFDELHAFWFIEFLQEICVAFTEKMRGRKVAVIVDNSPGYVGIAPAVQEWLTDLGPDKGKFLTVTSLDKQDFMSCATAVDELQQLLTIKCEAGQKFAKSCEPDATTLELAQIEVPFFERLAEISSSIKNDANSHITGADLSFHRKNKKGIVPAANTYQALIINRVPRDVKRGFYKYENPDIDYPDGVIKGLLGSDKRNIMVGYDPYIEYQFVYSELSRRDEKLSRRQRNFMMHFPKVLETRLVSPGGLIPALLTGQEKLTPENINKVAKYISALDSKVAQTRNILEQNGFQHLSRMIDGEWLPSSVLAELKNAIRIYLTDSHFPYFEPYELDEDNKFVNAEIFRLLEHLPNSIRHISHTTDIPEGVIKQLSPSLVAAVSLSMNHYMIPTMRKDFVELFGAILMIEATHWYRKRNLAEAISIPRFLATDKLDRSELKELSMEMHIHPRWVEEGNISELYEACARTQSRLLDLRQDAQFIIDMLCRLVEQEIHKPLMMPYVRDIAEEVIVTKQCSYENGMKQLARGFATMHYMDNFSSVLKRILMQWKVVL